MCVLGDSLLVINQTNGKFKVKSPLLVELYEEVNELKSRFKYIEFNHVYREYNVRADELSNLALNNTETMETTETTDIKDTEYQDLGIKKMDEEWIEEIKLDSQILVPKTRRKQETCLKQTTIQRFFKKTSLFPDI